MNNPNELSELIAHIKNSAGYWGEMARIEFAQLLNEEMHKQNVNQSQLAARLGVSPQYIHKVLAGDCACSLRNMARLMFALRKRLRFYSTPLDDNPIAEKAEKLSRELEEFALSVRATKEE